MSNDDLNKNGFISVKVPTPLLATLRKSILHSINDKFKKNKFVSYQPFFKFLKKTSDKDFKDKFGLQVLRILDANNTKIINTWVKKVIPKKLNCKKASLNIITKSEYKKNNYLKDKQFCAFYRIVRKNQKDVQHAHRDSSFWALGVTRKTNFKHNSVWKLWIPIMGVTNRILLI